MCAVVGLHPESDPLGDMHHTEVKFSDADKAVASIAYFLGTMWDDADQEYFYNKRTSIDEWSRVARALRIHGLKIINDPDFVPEP